MAGIFDTKKTPSRVTFEDAVGGAFSFDCVVSESHVVSQTLTTHPVEDGSAINDHTIKPPNKLRLKTIKSSHPFSLENTIQNLAAGIPGSILSQSGNEVGSILGAVSTAVGISLVNDFTVTNEKGEQFTPVQVAFNALEKMRNESTVLTVITELKSYSNMIITEILVDRNSKNRYSLDADITLEEIRVAKSDTATITSKMITPPGNNQSGGAKTKDGEDVPDKKKLGGAKDAAKKGTKQGKTNSYLKSAFDSLFNG